MALIFTLILVVITLAGSLWVMYHLNTNMMPGHEISQRLNAAATARIRLAGDSSSAALAGIADARQPRRLAGPAPGLEARSDRAGRAARPCPPVAAPGPAQWPQVNARQQRISPRHACGRYLHDRETLVQAVTERGGGFWVLTPFETDDGYIVLINRGFVPPDAARSRDSAAGPDRRRHDRHRAAAHQRAGRRHSCAPTIPRPTAGIRATSRRSPRHAA